ncbi:bestrophin-like domain [Thalassotalea litorea]|uniref:bestrophin-like domain n=1 Tax=Thalassotalea litorea TaxID=2020715 RepID=UPI0037368243
MSQQILLYGYSSITIVVTLFVVIIVLNEIGFRIGRYVQSRTDSEAKSLTGSIQASILGLLALLLGFTFSMSMQRFDSRSLALIDEANAIGTAILRVQLLPSDYRNEAKELLNEYVRLRVEIGRLDLTKKTERLSYNQEISSLQKQLWSLAIKATAEDPRPVTTGAFVSSLNQLIDSQGKRNALLQMQVPEVVVILLFVAFISSGGIMGYSAGLSGTRMLAPIVLVSILIALIVFIIIDLDRPKRGLIKVNQSVMFDLLNKGAKG